MTSVEITGFSSTVFAAAKGACERWLSLRVLSSQRRTKMWMESRSLGAVNHNPKVVRASAL